MIALRDARLATFALVVATAGIAVLPPATAAGFEAHAEAETLRTEGISLLSAHLLALLQEAHEAPTSPPAFHLTAAAMRVETTVRDPTLHAQGLTVGMDAQTTSRDFHSVAVTGLSARLDDRLDVFPIPGHDPPRLQAETGCSSWTDPVEENVMRQGRISTRDDRSVSVPVAGGARVTECGANAQWKVTGDFLVLLWERDARLASHEGKDDLRSGRLGFNEASRAEEGGASQAAGRDQELYLYVTDGQLHVPMDLNTVAYVAADAGLWGARSLELRKATLQVGSEGLPVQAGDLDLRGSFDLRLQNTDGRVSFGITGMLASGQADGVTFGGPADAAEGPVPQQAGMGAVGGLGGTGIGLALAAFALLGFLVRRRRQQAK